MRNIWTIVKKELTRVFTDKGMIISLFLLPPLTIYLIYGLMGMSAKKETEKMTSYAPVVYVVNAPGTFTNNEKPVASFADLITYYQNSYKEAEVENLVANAALNYVSESEYDEVKDKLEVKEIDLIIYFPTEFVSKVLLDSAEDKPEIGLLYNVNKTYSQNTYYDFLIVLNGYEDIIAGTKFDLDKLNIFNQDVILVGDTEKAQGQILGMILPLLLMVYLFTGAMGVGMESVAGEKERGTIATLLVTPIKRRDLAIGKIISISIISVLSSIASFLGLLAVMPSFAQIGAGDEDVFGKLTYGVTDYLMLFAVMFVAVLMFVGLVVVISTISKSTKQAGTLVTPLMLIVMGTSFFNMFNMEVAQDTVLYLIPVYNINLVLKAIFQFNITFINWLLTIISTCVYISVLVFLIQRMFKSEKIMFNK